MPEGHSRGELGLGQLLAGLRTGTGGGGHPLKRQLLLLQPGRIAAVFQASLHRQVDLERLSGLLMGPLRGRLGEIGTDHDFVALELFALPQDL